MRGSELFIIRLQMETNTLPRRSQRSPHCLGRIIQSKLEMRNHWSNSIDEEFPPHNEGQAISRNQRHFSKWSIRILYFWKSQCGFYSSKTSNQRNHDEADHIFFRFNWLTNFFSLAHEKSVRWNRRIQMIWCHIPTSSWRRMRSWMKHKRPPVPASASRYEHDWI